MNLDLSKYTYTHPWYLGSEIQNTLLNHISKDKKYNILEITEYESYAANCIWVNDKVLLPEGYQKARKTIENAGYEVKEVDVSEFRKLDGGLSCLSLRF